MCDFTTATHDFIEMILAYDFVKLFAIIFCIGLYAKFMKSLMKD